jgi:uncharacterized membrane protein YuzA (DUF378 family)
MVMRGVHLIALILVIVGALNWGLVGVVQFDLVAALFGGQAAVISRIVYALVGLSGLVVAATAPALSGRSHATSRVTA